MEKSRLEKGGVPLDGITLAICESPLPPIDEAIGLTNKFLIIIQKLE